MKQISDTTEQLITAAGIFFEVTKDLPVFLKLMKSIIYHESMLQDMGESRVERYTRKETPFAINFLVHQANARTLFADENSKIKRAAIVPRLAEMYGVGFNKVEEKNGFLAHLFRLKLIKRSPARGVYLPGPELFVPYPDAEKLPELIEESMQARVKAK
jgi:hypothetical protein